MKKTILLLAILFSVGFTSCIDHSEDPKPDTVMVNPTSDTVLIGTFSYSPTHSQSNEIVITSDSMSQKYYTVSVTGHRTLLSEGITPITWLSETKIRDTIRGMDFEYLYKDSTGGNNITVRVTSAGVAEPHVDQIWEF